MIILWLYFIIFFWSVFSFVTDFCVSDIFSDHVTVPVPGLVELLTDNDH